MSPRPALKSACDAILADPKLKPRLDASGNVVTTFCNMGAMRVAAAMGCRELNGLTADRQYAVMAAGGRWHKVAGAGAALHALNGGLAFASSTGAMLGSAHGHICALYPAPMQPSPSLGKDVPMVANIGKTCGLMKCSAAFPVAKGEPHYFVWS